MGTTISANKRLRWSGLAWPNFWGTKATGLLLSAALLLDKPLDIARLRQVAHRASRKTTEKNRETSRKFTIFIVAIP